MTEEDRVYIKPDEIASLPKGLRIYRGPKGGIYYKRSEYEQIKEREGKDVIGDAPTEKQVSYVNSLKNTIMQRLNEKWEKEYSASRTFGLEHTYYDMIAIVALKMWIKDKVNEAKDKKKMSDLIDKLKKVDSVTRGGFRGLHMSLPKLLGSEYEIYYDRVLNALYDVGGSTSEETSKMKMEMLNKLWSSVRL